MIRTILVTVAAMCAAASGPSPAAAGDGGRVEGTVQAKRAKYRRHVVVYLVGGKTPKPPDEPAVMDQRGMVFRPHVLPIVKGTTVEFVNSDSVSHNVFSPDHDKYNLGTWRRGESRSHTFDKAGVYTQLCNLHQEMLAYIVVLETAHFAVTDADGAFAIDDVPPGTYELKVWSAKRRASPRKVKVSADDPVRVDIELTK